LIPLGRARIGVQEMNTSFEPLHVGFFTNEYDERVDQMSDFLR
jgi:hypothetical protein